MACVASPVRLSRGVAACDELWGCWPERRFDQGGLQPAGICATARANPPWIGRKAHQLQGLRPHPCGLKPSPTMWTSATVEASATFSRAPNPEPPFAAFLRRRSTMPHGRPTQIPCAAFPVALWRPGTIRGNLRCPEGGCAIARRCLITHAIAAARIGRCCLDDELVCAEGRQER